MNVSRELWTEEHAAAAPEDRGAPVRRVRVEDLQALLDDWLRACVEMKPGLAELISVSPRAAYDAGRAQGVLDCTADLTELIMNRLREGQRG